MNPKLRNILAVIAGFVIGSLINYGLVVYGHSVYPIEGVDPNDMEALNKVMPTLEFKYFIFPFLAHALGTFAGAATAAWIAVGRKMIPALIVGGLFLLGGIYAATVISAPTWFVIADLVLAYLPMACLGGKFAKRLSGD
ncbi:MAG: hypothetical protein HKN89_09990 [Eudoraea sp.]|nr:hypothetical protein [Eudoraea sp.]